MSIMTRFVIVISLLVSLMLVPQATHPVQAFGTDDEGHERIVRNGLRPIVVTLSDVEPLKFTEKAIEEIVDANEFVDLWEIASGEAHFDNESFLSSTNRLKELREDVIKLLLQDNPNGQEAREKLGEALHTLQDFYAHTNWVDIKEIRGISLPEPTGINDVSISRLGDKNDTKFCPVQSDVLDTQYISLTSGHFALWDITGELGSVPPGKCFHGFDQLGIFKSGIAKDSPLLSIYHSAAKEYAITATKRFVEGIIDQIKNDPAVKSKVKAIRALLGASAPLTFVIDDSGSMGAEIAGVKSEVAKLVILAKNREYPPQQYILVRFNDPQIGPISMTSNPDTFLQAINAIRVGDGGDCPELYYQAMKEAIDLSPEGAEIYSFTDASAKDEYLSGDVIALAREKEIVGNVAQTGTCGFAAGATMNDTNTLEQATPQADLMQSNDAGFISYDTLDLTSGAQLPQLVNGTDAVGSSYARLASETGGTFFSVSSSDIPKVFDVIRTRVLSDTTPMLYRTGNLSSTLTEVPITIDSSVSVVNVVVTLDRFASTFNLRNPAGVIVNASTPNVTVQTLGANRIYTLNGPAAGIWRLQFAGTGAYTARVSGSSTIQFNDFEFVEPSKLVHVSERKIPGQPVVGVTYRAQARALGNIFSPSFQLVAENGAVLQNLSLTATSEPGNFNGTFVPPSQSFRIQMSGTNTSGQPILRLYPTLYNVKSVEVRLDDTSFIKTLAGAISLSGQTIPMNFVVKNYGPTAVFSITAAATGGQITAIQSPTITLSTGMTQTLSVSVALPRVNDERRVAVSFVATNAANTTDRNSSVATFVVPNKQVVLLPVVSR